MTVPGEYCDSLDSDELDDPDLGGGSCGGDTDDLNDPYELDDLNDPDNLDLSSNGDL
jgi:hypothetical protein